VAEEVADGDYPFTTPQLLVSSQGRTPGAYIPHSTPLTGCPFRRSAFPFSPHPVGDKTRAASGEEGESAGFGGWSKVQCENSAVAISRAVCGCVLFVFFPVSVSGSGEHGAGRDEMKAIHTYRGRDVPFSSLQSGLYYRA
jgi:hypothetical protein